MPKPKRKMQGYKREERDPPAVTTNTTVFNVVCLNLVLRRNQKVFVQRSVPFLVVRRKLTKRMCHHIKRREPKEGTR